MKINFKLKEVKKNIFLLEFNNNYDMCMMFLRYQEFYESSSSKFRNKPFKILDFMKWYSVKYGKGIFTYPEDWDGFNFPDYVIKDVVSKIIPDHNEYDEKMFEVYEACRNKSGGKFYIIGIVKKSDALKHEIAHAFFYLYPEFKKEMTKLVKDLDPKIKKHVNMILKRAGYTYKVYVDETQAYMATGLADSFVYPKDMWVEERKPFEKLFNKFYKKIK